MAFPLIPLIVSALSAVPPLISAYKEVKKLDDVPSMTAVPDGKVILDLAKEELNGYKLETVVNWLLNNQKIKAWLVKYGLNKNDLKMIVNAACVLRKVINFNIKRRSRKV